MVIGVGALGARHLQSLVNLSKEDIKVYSVDPNKNSLDKANEIYSVSKLKGSPDAEFYADIEQIPIGDVDLAIVATNSIVRLDVVSTLLANKKVRNIVLEKFLFPRESDYIKAEKLFAKHQVNVWVNCPRRLHPVYEFIKNRINQEEKIQINVIGHNWGLGCNSIHSIDILNFLSNQVVNKVEDFGLRKKLEISKRPGYVEFTGSIKGHTSRGDLIFLHDRGVERNGGITYTIEQESKRFIIFPGRETVLYFWESEESPNFNFKSFQSPYQSELTHVIVEEILDTGVTRLPTYNQLSTSHLPLLACLLQHYNLINNTKSYVCPIT